LGEEGDLPGAVLFACSGNAIDVEYSGAARV
jgi:hypothetical protein